MDISVLPPLSKDKLSRRSATIMIKYLSGANGNVKIAKGFYCWAINEWAIFKYQDVIFVEAVAWSNIPK